MSEEGPETSDNEIDNNDKNDNDDNDSYSSYGSGDNNDNDDDDDDVGNNIYEIQDDHIIIERYESELVTQSNNPSPERLTSTINIHNTQNNTSVTAAGDNDHSVVSTGVDMDEKEEGSPSSILPSNGASLAWTG